MNAIETVGLTKAFGEKHAVDALDLTVKRGEIYGFVGRNGAGKSTVMKMLAGLVLPTSGEIALLGEHQNRAAQADAWARLSRSRACCVLLPGWKTSLAVRCLSAWWTRNA